MKTLYLDCNMGVFGNGLFAAMLELADDPNACMDRMNEIGRKLSECNRKGMESIEKTLRYLYVSEEARKDVATIFHYLVEAKSHVHGKPISEVRFDEIGTWDEIASLIGVCLLMGELKPEQVLASPVRLGSGTVSNEKGTFPVPAPETAYLLRGVPVYGGDASGEQCTAVGAAILKHFVNSFGPMTEMKVDKIGYGKGPRVLGEPKYAHAYLGETWSDLKECGELVELTCHFNGMTGKEMGCARDAILRNGAFDVLTIPVQMKRNQVGVLMVCLCEKEKSDTLAKLMLKRTTASHVRRHDSKRIILDKINIYDGMNVLRKNG